MGVQCSAGAIIALLALTSPNLLHYFVSDDVPRVKMTKHWLLGLLAVPAGGQKVISLGPSVTLSYSITGDQASVSVVYEGTAWLGFGVTSLKMAGSKICIGSSAGVALLQPSTTRRAGWIWLPCVCPPSRFRWGLPTQ